MLQQMLSKYETTTYEQKTQALREVMQEIALAGLYRGGFFEKAAFYGGTCLRIFHQLPRFSEDLDFSLLAPQDDFKLAPYFEAVENEFQSLGVDIVITQKVKTNQTAIESAFLKNTTQIFDITAHGNQAVKIKFEVDTAPPLGFKTEDNLLLEPFSFYVKCFALPDLFAGKMHALLFRRWKNRVKGRDWFDFEWYIRKNIPMNLEHFNLRALQSGDINKALLEDEFKELLLNKIADVDVRSAKEDIQRFILEPNALDIWSTKYFSAVAGKIKITQNSHVD